VSITSPYKEFYLKDCITTDFSQDLNAINCLIWRDGNFFATNTDYLACQDICKKFLENLKKKKVIVFGSGPMSRVIEKVLDENNISFQIYSRRNNNFETLDARLDFTPLFVINCLSRKIK